MNTSELGNINCTADLRRLLKREEREAAALESEFDYEEALQWIEIRIKNFDEYQRGVLRSAVEEIRAERAPNDVEKFLAAQPIQRFSDIGKRQSDRHFQSYEEYAKMKRKERE